MTVRKYSWFGIVLALVGFSCEAAEFKQLQLRFTAAYWYFGRETLPPEQSDLNSLWLKAGFDLVFRGSYFDDGKNYPITDQQFRSGEVLYGGGDVEFKTDTGANDCSGAYAVNPDVVIYIPKEGLLENGPIKTVAIANPARYGNTNTTALLQNSAAVVGKFGYCRVPGVLPGISGNPSVSFTPTDAVWTGDASSIQQVLTRVNKAVVKFDVRHLPTTIPISFSWDSSSPNGADTIVWFGQIEVSEGSSSPTPNRNPFALGGYKQPQVGEKPEPPPVKFTQTNISPEEWKKWLQKEVAKGLPGFKALVSQFPSIQSGGTPFATTLPNGATLQYDPTLASLRFENMLPAAVGNGKLRLGVVLVPLRQTPPNNLQLPAGSQINSIQSGTPVAFSLSLKKGAVRALSSARAYRVFVVATVKPSGSKEAYTQIAQFVSKKRS